MHTDRCGDTSGQKSHTKGNRKETEMQEFLYWDSANVEYEVYDCTSSNWSHWKSERRFKETFGIHARKTFNRFTKKDSCTWNSTHIKWKVMQSETWSLSGKGSPLVQEEKYQGEKRQRNNNNNNNSALSYHMSSLWSYTCPYHAGKTSLSSVNKVFGTHLHLSRSYLLNVWPFVLSTMGTRFFSHTIIVIFIQFIQSKHVPFTELFI